jgi:hypothetical protein
MKTLRRLSIAALLSLLTANVPAPAMATDDPCLTITDNVVTASLNCGSVVIPSTVISIGDNAFKDATSLTDITIPSSVTSIGYRAFFGATNLVSVNFEAGSALQTIGTQAFFGDSKLNSINVPSTVNAIGSGAFYGVTGLTSITIPSNLSSLEYSTFQATGLTSITIPSSVTSIAQSVFEGTKLASVTFEANSNLTTIGGRAFLGINELTTITIPSSVNSIGGQAFDGTKLTSLNFEANSNLTTIGNYAFNNPGSITLITLPNKVTTIGDYAFASAASLTGITIPSSVTSIGYRAFFNASSLATVNFDGNAPGSVGSQAFASVQAGAVANIGYGATGFGVGTWNGLTLQRSTGPALTPTLSSATRTADGYTLQITNYDADYTWAVSVTVGSVTVNSTGEVTVSGLNAGESSTLTITTTRQYYSSGSATDTASALAAPASVPETPTPYSGPLPTGYSDRTPSIGDEVIISGRRMNLVTSCTIDGVTAVMSNQSADSFTIMIPAGLEPGLKDLVMTGPAGKLTAQGALTVQESIPAIINEPLVSSKLNAGSFNGYVAVFAKGHKGKTLAWKIAGKWFKRTITSDYQVFQRKTAEVGLDVDVDLYIDGEKQTTKTARTR